MAKQKNLVSMVLTEQDEADVKSLVEQVKHRLKGAITLNADQRKKYQRMGTTRQGHARDVIRILQENPGLVPPGLDLAGATADQEALDRIERIDDAVQALATLTRDTRTALGIDIMGVASVGYTMSKAFGDQLGLGDLLKKFGARFSGGRKPKGKPGPESHE